MGSVVVEASLLGVGVLAFTSIYNIIVASSTICSKLGIHGLLGVSGPCDMTSTSDEKAVRRKQCKGYVRLTGMRVARCEMTIDNGLYVNVEISRTEYQVVSLDYCVSKILISKILTTHCQR